MKPTVDWLDVQIDRMQAGRSLRPIGLVESGEAQGAIAMLQMAARLSSLRPGALDPDPAFLDRLRERVLAACDEAAPSHGPRILDS